MPSVKHIFNCKHLYISLNNRTRALQCGSLMHKCDQNMSSKVARSLGQQVGNTGLQEITTLTGMTLNSLLHPVFSLVYFSLVYSFCHSLIHSFTHSLIHS